MLNSKDIKELAKIAKQAALLAADYIAYHANHSHQIVLKDGVGSLAKQVVTAIDMESQRLILAHLKPSIAEFDFGLLTEELVDDGSRLVKEYFWCIDPLDGTLPFTEQQYGYAVSIALVSRTGEAIIGIVIDPHQNDRYVAIKNQGVWRNEWPYKFKQPNRPESLICHFDRSFRESVEYDQTIEDLQALCNKLNYQNLDIRTGFGAVMNACGLLDISAGCYFKLQKSSLGGGCIWDFASTRLIYEELGLHVSTINGKPLPLNNPSTSYMNNHGVIYATNLQLGKELIQMCRTLQK